MIQHPSEEEMVDGYYAGLDSGLQGHLNGCPECAGLYRRICEALETVSEAGLPQRNAHYGAEVWARVSSNLPLRPRSQSGRGWLLVPVAAAALGLMFIAAGMWTRRQATTHPTHALSQLPVAVSHLAARKLAQAQQPLEAKHKMSSRAAGHATPNLPPVAAPLSPSVEDARLLDLNSLLEVDAKALPEVLEMINGHTSDRTKEHALFVLAQSDSHKAHQALMDFAKQESDPPLQAKAVRMMGLMGSDGERRELAGLYQTSPNLALKREIVSITDAREQTAIVFSKGAFPADKRQLLNSVFLAADSQVLLDVLKKQPDAGMRVATIHSLAVMGEQSQVLATVYRTDKDATVRRAVLDALVVQQNSHALGELARDEPDASRKADILIRLASIRVQTPDR